MSVSIKWDEFKPVIHCVFHGDWTIEEFRIAAQAVEQMMNMVGHRVHTLINMEDAVPSFSLPQIDGLPYEPLSNAGTLIFVGSSSTQEMLGERLAQIFCYPVEALHFVEAMHEAEHLLFGTPLRLQKSTV